MTILIIDLLSFRFSQPSIDDQPKRLCAQVMKLVPSLPHGRDKARRFQNIEVLRNALPSSANVMLHRQPAAQFKKGLTVPLHQLVHNCSTGRRHNSFEDIAHYSNNRQVATCLSRINLETT
jgi:hypothetical protein